MWCRNQKTQMWLFLVAPTMTNWTAMSIDCSGYVLYCILFCTCDSEESRNNRSDWYLSKSLGSSTAVCCKLHHFCEFTCEDSVSGYTLNCTWLIFLCRGNVLKLYTIYVKSHTSFRTRTRTMSLANLVWRIWTFEVLVTPKLCIAKADGRWKA